MSDMKRREFITREFFARVFDLCTVRLDGRLSARFRTIQICPKDLLATLREAERAGGRRLGPSAAGGHSRAGEADVRHQTA
jgi:hypothetical protein